MQKIADRIIYSASDLNKFLECDYLLALDLEALNGKLARPAQTEYSQLITDKGIKHETRYLERQRGDYDGGIVELPSEAATENIAGLEAAEAKTREAMASGAKVIYQAAFFDGQWFGRSDFLVRVERPSKLGDYSYEVLDTKLALHTKPYFIVQLCFYSEQLARVQGVEPEFMHVVLGNGERETHRVSEYSAYCAHLKQSFLKEVARILPLESPSGGTVPMPVKHCEVCHWDPFCTARREQADHLSLVAWMRTDQIRKLEGAQIQTMTQLAEASDGARPPSLKEQTFANLRTQAALQIHRHRTGEHKHVLHQADDKLGFGLLPEPDPGDVFFDMEGDPLYEPARNLYYLFGAYLPNEDRFVAFWAQDPNLEKVAFERFIDFVVERRKRFPNLHVYHYARYEKTALRTLSVQYAAREGEVDDLLRGEVLVDLFAVVRQTLRISQPKYGIKYLEPFYDFTREGDLRRGDESILVFEEWRETQNPATLEMIERYNEADCRSTWRLHQWLLKRRLDAIAAFGSDIPWRPAPEPKTKTQQREEELTKLTVLQRDLLAGLPEIETRTQLDGLDDDRKARWLLGHLLGYHRREEKPVWWKFFDRCEKTVEELRDEDREAIGGLELCTDIEPYKETERARNLVYTYRFPPQEHNLGSNVVDALTTKPADLISVDDDTGLLKLKINPERAGTIRAIIPGGPLATAAQQASLRSVAREYLEETPPEAKHPAVLDILLRRAPRLTDRPPGSSIQPSVVGVDQILSVVRQLDRSYLFIQGPPGTGKSTKGSEIITRLLNDGKRVGIMSNSHKAIQNLLCKIEECAHKTGVSFSGLYKGDGDETSAYRSPLRQPLIFQTNSNDDCESGGARLVAGTSWLFAREKMADAFDYLFIDEAGQIALANAIAVGPCAKNIVLLGDPLQLAQVSQGAHQLGLGASVLEHLLGDEPTIPPDRGIFLDVSYRMHPQICTFISDAVYAGRLKAAGDTQDQYVQSDGLSGHGLRYIPIEHFGNSRSSGEEAERVVREIEALRKGRVKTTKDQVERDLTDADILVVSPYNAQRKLIRRLLERAGINVRVGTVDKFQGQEAPVVFYSMATSSGEDLPRDINFLFEKNRLNVAISRAQCMSVLVASPHLLDVRCSSAAEISMVNLLCRCAEAPSLIRAVANSRAVSLELQ